MLNPLTDTVFVFGVDKASLTPDGSEIDFVVKIRDLTGIEPCVVVRNDETIPRVNLYVRGDHFSILDDIVETMPMWKEGKVVLLYYHIGLSDQLSVVNEPVAPDRIGVVQWSDEGVIVGVIIPPEQKDLVTEIMLSFRDEYSRQGFNELFDVLGSCVISRCLTNG